MKQSTKLLSIVLALVMCFGCFSVVGNAALKKGDVHYDSIDNAALTAEQAADVLLDYVDSILPNDELDLSVIGTLHLDTLNQLIPDVYDLLDSFIVSIAGGDASALRANRSILKGWNRTGNNIGAVQKLLKFLGTSEVRGVVAKAPYGLLTNNGIKIGGLVNGIVAGLVDLGDINDILTDLPGFLTKMVFDGLLYGSYPYQGARYDYEDDEWTGLPEEADNIDKILNVAAKNLLTKPQDNSWKDVDATDANGVRYGDYTAAMGKGEVSEDGKQVKIWDMNSVISKTFKGSIDITTSSFFEVLDTLLPYAYDEYGIHGLNHTLKKIMMEAMGVDFIETTYAELPSGAKKAFGTDVAASYCNYAMKDLIWKDAGTGLWYYTDVRNRAVDLDKDGVDDVDEEGNVIKDKTRVYFVADITAANDLANLLNWDYAFDSTSFGTADAASGITGPNGIIKTYGSLFGSLNHLLFLILDIAGNDAVITRQGINIVDVTDNNKVVWVDGGNDKLNANLLTAVKFTLNHYSATIFGKDNAYVDANGVTNANFLAQVNDKETDIIDLVAYIGLPLFNDAMPQLIMPKNADGTYAFHNGSQVFEFGALVIREFLTDIAPAVNYDSDIFSVLPSAGSRQFKVHTNQEWYNIILNMGLDVAYTFLNGYTNFDTEIPAKDVTETRWKGMLTAIATWGVNYIGEGNSSALAKLDPNTVTAKGNGFAMIDYALNTLLPLGFVSNCSGNGYDFDLEALFNKIYNIADSFDIAGLLSLIGRNTAAADSAAPNGVKMNNILNNKNVVKQILDLAQRILYLVAGTNLLPATTNCATLLTSANIGTLASNLLAALDTRSGDLLNNLLPVVIVFFPEFAGEQELGTPVISFSDTYSCSGGTLGNTDLTVSNGSKGVWRHGYLQDGTEYQDNQYVYQLTGVKAYNFDGSASSYVTINSFTNTKIDFGQTGTISFKAAGVPAEGAVVRFVISYLVYNEDSEAMSNGQAFTISKYVYLSYNPTNSREYNVYDKESVEVKMPKNIYISVESVGSLAEREDLTGKRAKGDTNTSGKKASVQVVGTATYGGITLANVTAPTLDYALTEEKNQSAKTWTVGTVPAADDGASYTFKYKLGVTYTPFMSSAKTAYSGELSTTIYTYSQNYFNKLQSLVSDEVGKLRLASGYKTGNDEFVYAATVLETAPNKDGLVETAFADTGFDPEGDPDTLVTKINCAQAWTNYQNALKAAIRGAWQVWNANSVYNFCKLYKDLYTASRDVEYLKEDAAAAAAAGGIDAAVVALAKQIDDTNAALNGDNRDFKAYRWERFITARSDARAIVSAYNTQNYAAPDDEYFPYNTSLDEAKLGTLAAKTAYNAYIVALKEAYSAEEMEVRVNSLDNAKNKYARYTMLDVEQASSLLKRTSDRLLRDNENAELYFLNQEIASATNIYGTTNTKNYSANSWARYTAALAAANAAAANGNNKTRFDAKYELQVAVNNLRTSAEEASYEELEMLMKQAEQVLANASYYNNTDKEFGKVLAALGLEEVDGVQLFPNSALLVSKTSYAADDQRKVDNAANALRAALAKMTFNSVNVNNAGTDNIGEDEKGNPISISTSHINPLKTAEAVKNFFKVTADGLTDSTTVVSVNGTYALSDFDKSAALTGTGSTVTFYKTVGTVKVPVATVTIVVDGDVNGDGAVDVLDAALVELTTNANASLDGVYKVAANLDTANEEITAKDLAEVVNIALTDYSKSEVA